MDRYEIVLQETTKEFSTFKIINKENSLFMKLINLFLIAFSFGKNKLFMERYITTINNTMYVPKSWGSMSASNKAIILRHERVHLRQSRDYGRFVFSLLYLFAWFPVKLAYYRVRFEQEAYQETIRATLEYCDGDKSFLTEDYKKRICDQFTTSYYGWMWYSRKDIEEWYDKFVRAL